VKVHFILDEASALGHMQQIDDAVDRSRAYGVRLIFYFQSAGQIKKCFPDGQDQTFLSQVTQIYFGVNDILTAEQVSKMLGNETIIVDSGGATRGGNSGASRTDGSQQSTSNNDGRSWGSTNNWAEKERALLQPAEVLNMHPRRAITFTPGCRPIVTWLTRYYEKVGGKKEKAAPSPKVKQPRSFVLGEAFVIFLAGLFLCWVFVHMFMQKANPPLPVQKEIQLYEGW
jgi:type IV secretion system protein VirD4